MESKPTLRLAEYQSRETSDVLTQEQREAVALASKAWQEAHRLSHPPLAFSGPKGETLTARQYVGVVEAGDICIEIYPKLDAKLLTEEVVDATSESVLANLLWLMEVTQEADPFAADTAALAEKPTSFFELFALLLARNLRAELVRGPVRRYMGWEDDLRLVRGKVRIGEQVSQNCNRMDKIACGWDEFTPDIALNRILRCACRFLGERVHGADTRRLLTDCREILDDVEDTPIEVALSMTHQVRHFDRAMERFRLSYDLAVRLLSGTGHALQAASAETFVFLVDMNDLFERYVHAVLEAKFRVHVRQQEPCWYLFSDLNQGRIAQKPDFYWKDTSGQFWIGDSKYKHLAKDQAKPLRFSNLVEEGEEKDKDLLAGCLLSPDDVRQLTVYAELDRRKRGVVSPASLMLLYPYIGSAPLKGDSQIAWNGSPFHLVPVSVRQTDNLAANLGTITTPL